MSEPVAVLISDVHYSLPTLELADAAMRMAISKANDLGVPLIVAGDLHDTKANMRAECVEVIVETLKTCMWVYILRGNHDSWNEKSQKHSLSFLDSDSVSIVDQPAKIRLAKNLSVYLIPYHSDPEELKAYLKTIPKGSTLIMHQGVSDSNSGHYLMDRTALPKESFADFRVISGHYHTRQTIKCRPLPRCIGGSFSAIQKEHAIHNSQIGTWDYIGNPYTLNFAEANDPPKGFQILNDDGTLEFVPTNLRRHVVIKARFDATMVYYSAKSFIKPHDLVWVKATGNREHLLGLNKNKVRAALEGSAIPGDFKLDLIPLDSEASKPRVASQTQPEILDGLIDSLTNTSDEQKERVKTLWKAL